MKPSEKEKPFYGEKKKEIIKMEAQKMDDDKKSRTVLKRLSSEV